MGKGHRMKVAAKKHAKKSLHDKQPKSKIQEPENLSKQLLEFGLKIKEIVGDGNCLFRSLADQHCGNQADHLHYRSRICEYIEQHTDRFAPFIYDEFDDNNASMEENLKTYVARMRGVSVFGGNMEIVACSQMLSASICIYQAGVKAYRVLPDVDQDSVSKLPMIQIAYHADQLHYSSVVPIEVNREKQVIKPQKIEDRQISEIEVKQEPEMPVQEEFPVKKDRRQMSKKERREAKKLAKQQKTANHSYVQDNESDELREAVAELDITNTGQMI